MEKNTFATSIYIDAPIPAVLAYLTDGMNLNEYTLFSRMREKVDERTWLGTASGYQAGLYYHVRHRELGALHIVEWHCGTELGKYYHVYPMILFGPEYFGSDERGTYYHWISFVDPARATPMIAEGLPTVHRSEARSLKGQLERRQGHQRAASGNLALDSHTIYVDAPFAAACAYLGDIENATEWGYMLARNGRDIVDEYGNKCELQVVRHDLGAYQLVEHDTKYGDTVIRTPLVLVPASYAFAQPDATGFIMHRVSAWPANAERRVGKLSRDDYDTEAINAKRIIEGNAGNLEAYARGCSYMARPK